jgi:hypothetical protein
MFFFRWGPFSSTFLFEPAFINIWEMAILLFEAEKFSFIKTNFPENSSDP